MEAQHIASGDSSAILAREHLHMLGISLLCEWDVLVFLHRHGAILTSAGQIAGLLGYGKAAVAAALERLESMGLAQRSRGSRGIRIYRFQPPADSRYGCFLELMGLAEKRTGRLLLVTILRRLTRREQAEQRDGLHLA
jgi:predicted ArsR family transcriptional regulator